jgi:hypothetical protein
MGWNGSGSVVRSDGTRTGETVWAQARDAAVKINAPDHDAHDEDLADAIQACINKNGENTPTVDLPMGGFKHTNVAAGSAYTHYARLSQVIADPHSFGGTSSGAANVFAFSLPVAFSAYAAGQIVRFIAHQNSTGACTINANSVGSIALTDYYGVMGTGSIKTGDHVVAFHNGTNFVRMPINGPRLQTFAPTLVPSGAMTFSTQSISRAIIGRDEEGISINVGGTFTVAGTPSAIVTFTTPYATSAVPTALSCAVWGGSGYHTCVATVASSTVEVRKLDGDFTAGTLRAIYINGKYPDA